VSLASFFITKHSFQKVLGFGANTGNYVNREGENMKRSLLNRSLPFFLLLYIIPILSFITWNEFELILHTIGEGWTKDVYYEIYDITFVLGPITTGIQFIYLCFLLVASLKSKNRNFILWSLLFLLLTIVSGIFAYIRVLVAASGI
jgi:hypothetical protein